MQENIDCLINTLTTQKDQETQIMCSSLMSPWYRNCATAALQYKAYSRYFTSPKKHCLNIKHWCHQAILLELNLVLKGKVHGHNPHLSSPFPMQKGRRKARIVQFLHADKTNSHGLTQSPPLIRSCGRRGRRREVKLTASMPATSSGRGREVTNLTSLLTFP